MHYVIYFLTICQVFYCGCFISRWLPGRRDLPVSIVSGRRDLLVSITVGRGPVPRHVSAPRTIARETRSHARIRGPPRYGNGTSSSQNAPPHRRARACPSPGYRARGEIAGDRPPRYGEKMPPLHGGRGIGLRCRILTRSGAGEPELQNVQRDREGSPTGKPLACADGIRGAPRYGNGTSSSQNAPLTVGRGTGPRRGIARAERSRGTGPRATGKKCRPFTEDEGQALAAGS